jgi:hypothetical protein
MVQGAATRVWQGGTQGGKEGVWLLHRLAVVQGAREEPRRGCGYCTGYGAATRKVRRGCGNCTGGLGCCNLGRNPEREGLVVSLILSLHNRITPNDYAPYNHTCPAATPELHSVRPHSLYGISTMLTWLDHSENHMLNCLTQSNLLE